MNFWGEWATLPHIYTYMFARTTKTFTQLHPFSADRVFELLCPEEEAKWLQHWQHEMIYSESGQVEQHAIFTTPHHGDNDTVWYTVRHYPKERYVEFVRVTPGDFVAHIELRVVSTGPETSETLVSYSFTPLTTDGREKLEELVLPSFTEQMKGWEAAINHYLQTGSMLQSED